jgi:ribonuclease HII
MPFPTNSNDAWVLGLDEAGRGPGLGPMVLCSVALDEQCAEHLTRLGVRDSKAYGSSDTSRTVRAQLAAQIEKCAAFVAYEVCEVDEIDRYVVRGGLNDLERVKAEMLFARAPSCTRIIADGRTLFSPLRVGYPHLEAVDRAESVHVAVAAASVCAKARRDTLFAEICARYQTDFGPLRGGGYMNPPTRAFVAEYFRRNGRLPPEARSSWPWPGISCLLPKAGLG